MNMTFSLAQRAFFKTLALTVTIVMVLGISIADARVGGGLGSGSRGMRTFSAPPATPTAPGVAKPFDRTMTAPSSPDIGTSTGAGRGFFGRPGLLGGLAAGFLGAGLFGMLFGGGLFGGLGGFSSLLGLILQIGLIVIVARMVMSWWQRRNGVAYAGEASRFDRSAQLDPKGFGPDFRPGVGSQSAPLEIEPGDYEAFEQLLGEIQSAWSNEDVAALHRLATPEMVSYFTKDLAANNARGVVNKVSGVKLLQGDLAESWRERETDYASVAIRFAFIDQTIDRASGRQVDGSDQPAEATEVWTFQRRRGSGWELSAIQQV
jgi:predicted lipid-binding transport protein (Tim44 family)